MPAHREGAKLGRWPSASQGERTQEKPNLTTPWSWIYSLQNCEKISFCNFSHPVWSILLWQPNQTPLLLASPISLLEFLTSGHLCLEWALDFVVYIWCLFRKLFPIFCWGCSECVSLRMLYLHFRLLCWMVRATAVRLLFFMARRSPSSLVICVLAFVGCRLNSFAVSTSLVPCNSSVA